MGAEVGLPAACATAQPPRSPCWWGARWPTLQLRNTAATGDAQGAPADAAREAGGSAPPAAAAAAAAGGEAKKKGPLLLKPKSSIVKVRSRKGELLLPSSKKKKGRKPGTAAAAGGGEGAQMAGSRVSSLRRPMGWAPSTVQERGAWPEAPPPAPLRSLAWPLTAQHCRAGERRAAAPAEEDGSKPFYLRELERYRQQSCDDTAGDRPLVK